MRIALAQINSCLGDFSSNREKILQYIVQAKENKCQLVVFPELALFGYPPVDLLERDSIFRAQWKQLQSLQKSIPKDIHVLLGVVAPNPKKGKPYTNAAILMKQKAKPQFFYKELLPSYDIFDDTRFFQSGNTKNNLIKLSGLRVLVTICEDMWGGGQSWAAANYERNPLAEIKTKCDLVINLSASPFSANKLNLRHKTAKDIAKRFKAPLIYVNTVGAQDEIIFDGGSFALNSKGALLGQCSLFREELGIVDLAKTKTVRIAQHSPAELRHDALVLGIRDFVKKTGLSHVHLGLSGGVDSAVVASLAAEALGSKNLTCIALPGPHSHPDSLKWAKQLAKALNCEFLVTDIVAAYEKLLTSLEPLIGSPAFGVTHENLQSRLRGLFLMAFSNSKNSLLLTTGNKSELATGYCTLYGDMCGGLNPLGDLLKHEVYELARWINSKNKTIPQEIIERAPSAELRPNQTDQDSLPPYDILDKAVEEMVVHCSAAKSKEEKWLLTAMAKSEFKRWQSPPILRVSDHAFGRGRRWPIAHKTLC